MPQLDYKRGMFVERMAVVGAGQMGSGIAQVAAQAGLEVLLTDATGDLARKGAQRIEQALNKLVEKGKLSPGDKGAALARIRPVDKIEDCGRAQLLIEAIVEDEAAKRELFQRADGVLSHVAQGFAATSVAAGDVGVGVDAAIADLERAFGRAVGDGCLP